MTPPAPLEALEAARADAVRALRRALAKTTRRATAIEGDLTRIAEARALAGRAAWLVAEAAKAPRGARELRGVDWSSGTPEEITLPIDPSRSAREAIDALFRKARRLEAAAPAAEERLETAWKEQAVLEDAAGRAERAQDVEELVACIAAARAALPRALPAPRAKGASLRDPQALPPYRTFHAHADAAVWVGKGAAKNDALTFEVARPFHLWMHARGVPGAHVIVPLKRGHACPAELLVDAAHLAAHFSDARGETLVEIATAPRKWVRKPRGAAPGAVVIEREKVLSLRVEPERLARLLARETPS